MADQVKNGPAENAPEKMAVSALQRASNMAIMLPALVLKIPFL